MKYLTYLIYIIVWDIGIIGGTFYATFILGHSYWWWLLAIYLSSSAYKPGYFGIEDKTK